MLGNIFNIIKSKMLCTVASGAVQGVFVPKNLLLDNTASVDAGNSLFDVLFQVIDFFSEIFISFFYIIAKYILLFVDMCQVLVYKLAGINTNLDKIVEMPIFRFIFNPTILKIFGTALLIGVLLLLIATIVAIVKSEYEATLDDKKDAKVESYKAVGKSAVTLFLMVITPFIIVISIVFSSVLLTSVNNVLNPNGTANATLGGQVFASSGINANKYRIYAENGQRLPILFDFEDPYNNGTYVDYTSEELAEIYGSWNGQEYYDKMLKKEFAGFASTVKYNNNKIYNSSSYNDFEKFVATAEQYYIMADFIDYAMAHDITFYIKDARDILVDWNSVDPTGKSLSETVYDPINQKLTVTYADVSGISPYNSYYTVTFEMGSAAASTPIQDAVRTISLLTGLFAADGDVIDEISSGALLEQSLSDIGVSLQDTALAGAANNLAGSLDAALNHAYSNVENGLSFRILERIEGSINVVKWQTEEALYGNQTFTVYELNKILKNNLTGVNETRATVKVAKKDDSLDTKYYILKEKPNEATGYYEYTNVTIDYYNDGKYNFDTLEPVYKYVSWPDKLYNDLQVIYSDIDFDNFINYDNWADALGEYFKIDRNVKPDDVATFATTLVHPLGLIMAELFMGTTFDNDGSIANDFGFTTAYLQDAIDSIVLSIGGQFNYQNLQDQIKYFVQLFNAQFAPVIKSLKTIEGFDIYGNDEMSVQCYVYKAYLASIMLATDYSDYLMDIAETILSATKLIELMTYGSSSPVFDSNGNPKQEVVYLRDQEGNKSKLIYNAVDQSKLVYSKDGERHPACNPTGIVWCDNRNTQKDVVADLVYVPKKDVKYKITYKTIVKPGTEIEIFGKTIKFPDATTNYYVYEVFSEKEGRYVEAAELAVNQMMQDYAVDPDVYAGKDRFDEYFELFYEYSNKKIYVYEPVDMDTSKEETSVKKVLYKTLSWFEGVWDMALGGGDVNNELKEYFLYETEIKTVYNNDYLTYGDLPSAYREVVRKIIDESNDDFKNGYIDKPVYFEFLEEYRLDSSEMKQVMAAKTINKKLADVYYNNYDNMQEEIKSAKQLMQNASTFEEREMYQYIIETNTSKICEMKKFYIIYAIESYLSTKISSDFNVVVNGHAYNVSQGINQRNLMEIVLGNNLTYEPLINALKNGQPYSKLSSFNQKAMETFSAFVEVYSDKIDRLLVSDGIFSGEADDVSLELASKLYTVQTGIFINLTNKSVTKLTDYEKASIKNALNTIAFDAKKIYENYIDEENLISGTLKTYASQDDAYRILAEFVQFSIKNDALRYVDDDYTGIIDNKGVGFGLLKEFLTSFGNICFDISRKSSISNISKPDKNNFLDFVTDFTASLNEQLKDVNFGLSPDSYLIDRVDNGENYPLKHSDPSMSNPQYFYELSEKSQKYVYLVYEYYKQWNENYKKEEDALNDQQSYIKRFMNNRYQMYTDSFIFTDALKEYLKYFRYNTDLDKMDGVYNEFTVKYTKLYVGKDADGNPLYEKFYDGSMDTTEDRIIFYNMYLEAFLDLKLGKNGVYYTDLTDLQKKVIQDMNEYFGQKLQVYKQSNEVAYNNNSNNEKLLHDFIFNGAKLDSAVIPTSAGAAASYATVRQIMEAKENLDLINLQNLLDYVGIEFQIEKTFQQYRLDALNQLVSFKERAGESGASIQSRYLTLLYLFCADYEKDALGATVIRSSNVTKNVVLRMAGLENKAEELLVGLEYEVDFTDYKADEAFGSVFVICTYNEDSKMYEPFLFATGSDKFGTPRSEYYVSTTGDVQYYPIIAKGVIDPEGRPTAIREIDGYIEFYRDNVTIMDANELKIDMHYLSNEEVHINYNPVNILVNSISKIFTGKTLAQHIIDAFPIIKNEGKLGFLYGSIDTPVYHLDNGSMNINYMFYEDSGIQMNCLYDVKELNIIILMLGSLLVAFSIVKAVWGLIRNLYEVLLLTLIYPGAFALTPLNDKPMGTWRTQFINKLFVMFGYIISLNAFFIMINILQNIDLVFAFSEESIEYLKNTYVFGKFNLSTIVSNLMEVAMFLAACTLLNTMPKVFSKLVGVGDDVISKGDNTVQAVRYNTETAAYFSSGYMIEDVVLSKTDKLKKMPLIGSKTVQKDREKRHMVANRRAVKTYQDNLKAMGISDDVIEKATKAYEESLNRELEAERERRNRNEEARNARLAGHKTRGVAESERHGKEHSQKKDKIKRCPNCYKKQSSKNKNCYICGAKM